MRERRHGRVVVISSVAALGGLPGQVAYAASKAGQLGMVRTLAVENAGRGITVNAVLPGLVGTEQVLAMPAEVRERALASAPGGRLVEPAEIAAAVSFLAGPEAGQVNGQTIAVDGGASLTQLTLGSSLLAACRCSYASASAAAASPWSWPRRRSPSAGKKSVESTAAPTSAAAVEARIWCSSTARVVIATTRGSWVAHISASVTRSRSPSTRR